MSEIKQSNPTVYFTNSTIFLKYKKKKSWHYTKRNWVDNSKYNRPPNKKTN